MLCPHLHEVCWIALAVSELMHCQLHVLRKAMDVLHHVCLQRSLCSTHHDVEVSRGCMLL